MKRLPNSETRPPIGKETPNCETSHTKSEKSPHYFGGIVKDSSLVKRVLPNFEKIPPIPNRVPLIVKRVPLNSESPIEEYPNCEKPPSTSKKSPTYYEKNAPIVKGDSQ